MRSRSDCSDKCKRYNYDLNSPCLWGSGRSDARLMFVGRDPGRQEDKRGKVFIGQSGELLDEILSSLGVSREDVYVTNSVKCGTPGKNVDPGKAEIKICRAYLEEEIRTVKPNVIVTLGNTAMEAVLGHSGIKNFYNRVFYSDEFDAKIIPTFHPAFVLRNPDQRKHLEQGVAIAISESESKELLGSSASKTKFTVAKTVEDVNLLFDKLEKVEAFAFDTETSQLSFINTDILCIQFSWEKGSAVVVPWVICEKSSELLQRLNYIMCLPNVIKIAHNIKFDIEQLLAKGIKTEKPFMDICVAHGLVDDNAKHDLGTMSLRYTNLGNYWQELENFKREYCKAHKIKIKDFSYAFVPPRILYPYGASDADATFQIYSVMKKSLQEEAVEEFYNNYSIPFIPMLIEMEYRGILVDREKLGKLLVQCEKKLEEYNQEISSNETIVEYQTWKAKKESIGQIRMLRARREASDLLKKRFPEWTAYVKKYLKLEPFEFNINSVPQLREIFCDILGCKSPKKTKGNLPSLDGDALTYFAEEKGIPLAALMNKRRKLAYFLSNFVESVYEKSARDGRIHTSYIQSDVKTGRLSSRDPNLQNLSRDENLPVLFTQEEMEAYKEENGEYPVTPLDFKACFLADPGYIFIKADLAQVEFRVWAHCSGDEDMIADIIRADAKTGFDIHRQTASELFGIPPNEVTKEQRSAAKGGTFGMMYGIGVRTLARNFNITVEQAANISEIFSARYPIAAQWLQKQIDFAHANGYVVSFLGRKRRLPKINEEDSDSSSYAERQARNSPIQGPASDMNNKFMERMITTVREKGEEIYPVATTHDENVFAVPDKPEIVQARIQDYKEIVLNTFPNLRCKMNAEFKVGYSIGGAKEVKA